MKLSILMPAFDEAATIRAAIRSVLDAPYPCEIELIVVDDGSTDGTARAASAIDDPRLRLLRHDANRGKGAALLSAAAHATGTHVVPFDADLEYSPGDLGRLLEPIVSEGCDVVYGARSPGVGAGLRSGRYALGNRALTTAANALFGADLCDLHTCLKLMPLTIFLELDLRQTGFGLDTEVTVRLLQAGIHPVEVPVSYRPRARSHGKKISWRDGIHCLAILLALRFGPRVEARATQPVPAVAVGLDAEA